MGEQAEDPILARIPVFLGSLKQPSNADDQENITSTRSPGGRRQKNATKPLSDRLVLMQFPTYSRQQSLSHANKLRKCQAQYKKASELYHVAVPLDTRSVTYAYERGLEYGVGSKVIEQQSKQNWQQSKIKKDPQMQEDDYYGRKSSEIDVDRPLEHLIFEGRRLPLVMSNAQYMVGRFRKREDGQRELHLTPLQSIVQFRPTNNHLDGMDKHEKQAAKQSINDPMSTDESASEQDDFQQQQQQQKQKEKAQSAQKKVAMQKKNEIVDATTAAHKRTIIKRLTEEESWQPLQIIDDMDQFGFVKDKLIHVAAAVEEKVKNDPMQIETETVSR